MSKVSLAGNASGTGIFTIASPNSNTDRTLTLPDNTGTLVTNTSGSVSQAMLASNVVGNGPTFSAYQSTSGGSVASTTFTKVSFDTEIWDTNSNYSSSRFTPTVAGYYQLNSVFQVAGAAPGFITLYKNGTEYKRGLWNNSASSMLQFSVNGLMYLNGSTDYAEVYVYQTSGGSVTPQGAVTVTWFDGCLVRSA
jgi:hypothetical protein